MQSRPLGTLEVAEQNMAAALGRVKQRSLLSILGIVPLEERIGADLANGAPR